MTESIETSTNSSWCHIAGDLVSAATRLRQLSATVSGERELGLIQIAMSSVLDAAITVEREQYGTIGPRSQWRGDLKAVNDAWMRAKQPSEPAVVGGGCLVRRDLVDGGSR